MFMLVIYINLASLPTELVTLMTLFIGTPCITIALRFSLIGLNKSFLAQMIKFKIRFSADFSKMCEYAEGMALFFKLDHLKVPGFYQQGCRLSCQSVRL